MCLKEWHINEVICIHQPNYLTEGTKEIIFIMMLNINLKDLCLRADLGKFSQLQKLVVFSVGLEH